MNHHLDVFPTLPCEPLTKEEVAVIREALAHGDVEDQDTVECHNFQVHIPTMLRMFESSYKTREEAEKMRGRHMVSDLQFDYLLNRIFGQYA